MARIAFTVATVACLAALMGGHSAAQARVTRVELLSQTAYGTFAPGEYVRFDFRVVGELVPGTEPIPDLELAARNPRGFIEYATLATLIAPADPGRGNGTLLVDVPNRGRPIAQSLFNSKRRTILYIGSFDRGTGFLQDNGFSTLAVAWEQGHGVELPSFVGEDGKPRRIEGVALPIVRDVADFFATASTDDAGVRNPLAGSVKRSIALGYSQTGRFLRSFMLRGFNRVERRVVFQGVHILGAAQGLIVLRSTPGTESGAGGVPTFADPEFRGVSEEPLAVSDVMAQVEQGGLPVPRTVLVNTTTDYFSLRSSLGRTGGSGTAERALPDSVRMYDVAGASHALVAGAGGCKYPYAVLDWHPVMRATLLALDRWVSSGTPPPPSRLMPLQPASSDSMALKAPAHLPAASILVPVLDVDGNATGGVRLPDVVAALGTHAAQNPPLTFLCALAAGYVPFAKSKREREASGDLRLSLEERYTDRNDYVRRIRVAARDLQEQGLLLSEDAAEIISSAAEASIPN